MKYNIGDILLKKNGLPCMVTNKDNFHLTYELISLEKGKDLEFFLTCGGSIEENLKKVDIVDDLINKFFTCKYTMLIDSYSNPELYYKKRTIYFRKHKLKLI